MFALSLFAVNQTVITIVMFAVIIVVFYFFLIRPQKKQEQAQQKMRNELMVGDEITTIGGIIGKITSIKGETVTIETSKDKTKIRFLKTAIRSVDVKAEESVVPVKTLDKAEEKDKADSDAVSEDTANVENGEATDGADLKKETDNK
ncbi:MAG: preprotein translocase subunit YajC [Eubacteriales bacterium]|nr:preprotein translocase subunit YajC [Eubacteriales bacterium]